MPFEECNCCMKKVVKNAFARQTLLSSTAKLCCVPQRRSPVLSPFPVSIHPVVALSITDTSLLEYSKHLLGFPLWPALLASLVGRDSDEYYPSSVTLGLSTRRAIPSSLETRRIEPDVGAAFAPFSEVILHRSSRGRFECRRL